jgi:hypothetical protein
VLRFVTAYSKCSARKRLSWSCRSAKNAEFEAASIQRLSAAWGRAEDVEPNADNSTFHFSPGFPVSLLPIMEILPAQMMSLALAAKVGRQSGKFRFATKITST